MNTTDLTQAIQLIKSKIQLNQEWLLKHFSNPYRSHVHRDNRELEVQLKTKQLNLDQQKAGLPSHGYDLPDENKTHLNVNINKNI